MTDKNESKPSPWLFPAPVATASILPGITIAVQLPAEILECFLDIITTGPN